MFRRIGWILLAGAWVFATASLASFDPYDPPSHFASPLNEQPTNWCGTAGAMLAYEAYHMLGPGSWLLLASVLVYLLATAAGRVVDQLVVRTVGIATMALATSGFVAVLAPALGAMPEGSGGLIALAAVDQLLERFSTLGTLVVLGICFAVGAMLAIDEVVLALPRGIVALCRGIAAVPWPKPVLVGRLRNVKIPRFGYSRVEEDGAEPGRRLPLKARTRRDAETVAPAVAELDEAEVDSTIESLQQQVEAVAGEADDPDDIVGDLPVETSAAAPEAEAEAEAEADEAEASEPEEVEEAEPEAEAPAAEPASLNPEQLRERIRKLPISIAGNRKPSGPAAAPAQDLSDYKFPEMSLLIEPEGDFSETMADTVRQQAEVLETALQTFRIDAEVVGIDAGPVITLYDVQLSPGTKVSQLNNIASDLARELKAQNIRIVANTAGKSTVGIEVPNLKKEKVRLKELMALAGENLLEKAKLPMFLGKDASGEPLIADLAAMPHMLIAGTTGSGKSVCMNSIIMSFLFTRRPDELKLILVDPKMVEMSQFKDIPHLMCPVITEMNRAAAILEWAVTKMDERYEVLAEAGVRDLDSYNAIPWEEKLEIFEPANEVEEAKIPRKIPRLVFVIDELADLMMTNREVENHIVRIAQKARAVGIHLILATQRPQANVVTGLIKSNMPCRVAFKVASGMDSRIVLDAKGAELLLGQGDMLYLSPRTSELVRAQGTLVDDAEVRRSVRFLKKVAAPSFEPQLVQAKLPGQDGEDSERDELFEDAVRIVLESRRGSVSLLQRRLAIGYSRSSRLVEQMAEAGILGEYKGSQAREVTLTLEEWDAMKAQAEADAGVIVNAAAAEAGSGLGYEAEQAEATEVEQAPFATGDDEQAIAEAETETEEGTEAEDEGLTDEERQLAELAGDDEYEDYEYVEEEDPA